MSCVCLLCTLQRVEIATGKIYFTPTIYSDFHLLSDIICCYIPLLNNKAKNGTKFLVHENYKRVVRFFVFSLFLVVISAPELNKYV